MWHMLLRDRTLQFANAPKQSLPMPRRVPVDSNDNKIPKTPMKTPRASVSKSFPQGSVSLGCNTPSKTTGETLRIIREFANSPKQSLPTRRRVSVDSNDNKIPETPMKTPRASVSKSLPQGSVSLCCNTTSKIPCQLQVSPNQARNHLISSKLNEHYQCSGACTSRELRPPNISSDEVENSLVLLNSEISSEKENIFVINDELAGKGDTPFKGKRFAETNISAILSLLSRCQKRETFVRSPALRVEVKDSMDGSGKRRKNPVSKSSTESINNQFQQCKITDDNVGKKINAPKSSAESHINKSDAAKGSRSHINPFHESKKSHV